MLFRKYTSFVLQNLLISKKTMFPDRRRLLPNSRRPIDARRRLLRTSRGLIDDRRRLLGNSRGLIDARRWARNFSGVVIKLIRSALLPTRIVTVSLRRHFRLLGSPFSVWRLDFLKLRSPISMRRHQHFEHCVDVDKCRWHFLFSRSPKHLLRRHFGILGSPIGTVWRQKVGKRQNNLPKLF